MKDKVNEIFNALQELDIKATPHNVAILDGVFDFLRVIYAELEKSEKDGEQQDGRAQGGTE